MKKLKVKTIRATLPNGKMFELPAEKEKAFLRLYIKATRSKTLKRAFEQAGLDCDYANARYSAIFDECISAKEYLNSANAEKTILLALAVIEAAMITFLTMV